MAERYQPFRNIRRAEDLRLAKRALNRTPATLRMPADPYYPEICVWVNVRCDESALFPSTTRALLTGATEDGVGWGLQITPHGYLRFTGGQGDEAVECESLLPVHATVDARREFRVGVALQNYAWSLRDTPYAAEAGAYGRLRLLVSPGTHCSFSAIGGSTGSMSPDLAPVPTRLIVGADAGRQQRFAGRITGVTAYNTAQVELFGAPRARSAARAVPIIPGGGGFEPRWIDDETVEVFTRPEFTQTASYWVFLRIKDTTGRLRRLIVHTIPHGGVNMTPTFFWSPDRERWRRIVPAAVRMGEKGADFAGEFRVTQKMTEGGYLASGPPFADEERTALLQWAQRQRHTTVREIGRSVEGRPIHLIRVGRGPDGPAAAGVAVICGQHSPLEIMGGRVIEPTIRRLLRRTRLLDACRFYFVPTVNVDCAHYGGNGLNANRRNNNRHWLQDIQPENAAVIECFEDLKRAGQRIDFALDIHAGGIFRNHVLMPMGPGDSYRPERATVAEQEVWLDLLEEHAGLRREDGWPLPQLKLRATDYFRQVHGAVAFCLELSSCSYFDPVEKRTKAFGTEAFEKLAEGLVRAWEARFGGE